MALLKKQFCRVMDSEDELIVQVFPNYQQKLWDENYKYFETLILFIYTLIKTLNILTQFKI